MPDEDYTLYLEDHATGRQQAWGRYPLEVARRFGWPAITIDSVLFNALRRARIKVPQGPDGRLSSGQYSKLMVGLNRFDQIRVAREARDARIESLEAFEESRRLPDGWKIIGERG